MTDHTHDVLESVLIETPARPPGGTTWPSHRHADHELLSSVVGTLTVTTDDAVVVVPRGAAFWLPADCPHEVHAGAGSTMRCTWFAHEALPDALQTPAVVQTTPLLEDVLRHVSSQTGARRRTGEAFAVDLLALDARPDDGLPRPTSAWLRRVTDQVVADPADTRSVERWATACAVSTRTFTRSFTAETGLPFATWRTRLRMQTAVAALGEGRSVASVARSVGFTSASAFTATFRRETGVTPSHAQRGTQLGRDRITAEPGRIATT